MNNDCPYPHSAIFQQLRHQLARHHLGAQLTSKASLGVDGTDLVTIKLHTEHVAYTKKKEEALCAGSFDKGEPRVATAAASVRPVHRHSPPQSLTSRVSSTSSISSARAAVHP